MSVRWVFWFEKVSLRPFFYPNRTGAVCCWISDARLFCQISHECQLTPDVFTLIGHAGGRAIGMCELKKFRIGGRLWVDLPIGSFFLQYKLYVLGIGHDVQMPWAIRVRSGLDDFWKWHALWLRESKGAKNGVQILMAILNSDPNLTICSSKRILRKLDFYISLIFLSIKVERMFEIKNKSSCGNWKLTFCSAKAWWCPQIVGAKACLVAVGVSDL